MLNYIKMVLSVIANVTRNTTVNLQKKKTPAESEFLIFNALCSVVTCLALIVACKGIHHISLYTFLLSILYGAALVTSYQTLICAMKEGPMSYTILISTCGMIIPTLFGTIAYKEAVSVFQIIGFILMPIGFYFGANPKKSEKITAKWVRYVFTCFFSNGMQGVLQKVIIRSKYPDENGMFLMSAFFIAAIILFVMYLIKKARGGASKAEAADDADSLNAAASAEASTNAAVVAAEAGKNPNFVKKYWLASIVGLADAFQHKVNTVLAGVLPSVICYPVINGGGIAGATLVSLLVFREKMDKKQIIGFVLCVASIILLCLV